MSKGMTSSFNYRTIQRGLRSEYQTEQALKRTAIALGLAPEPMATHTFSGTKTPLGSVTTKRVKLSSLKRGPEGRVLWSWK